MGTAVNTESLRRNVSLLSDHNLEAGRGDKTALLADDWSLTFAEVHRLVCRTASRLRADGVRRGERIVLVLDDSPAFHAAFLGAIRAGAVPVPVNFLARPEDFDHFMGDSYAVRVITDPGFLDKVGPAAERAGVDVHVNDGDTALSLDGWLAEGDDEVDPLDTHPDDPAFWLYSSGSTGKPKGVIHHQHDVVFTCEQYAVGVLGLRTDDVTFSTTKLFHAYGLGNGLTFPMYTGSTAIQMPGRPAAPTALDVVETHRPSVLFSVPTLYNAMLNDPTMRDRDLSSLRIGASAAEALPPEVWRRWHDRTGTEILDGIGSTEMLHIYCSNREGSVAPGTSGTAVPGYEVELRDESGTPVPDDGEEQTGELYVRGDSRLMTYWHNADTSARSIFGEWFRTGDRYRRTPEGNYAYEGRADDMMKMGGLWVSPIEVENRLMEHEVVSEAAVVAVDVDGLATIKAYVILRDGHDGDDDLVLALQEFCKDELLRYQFPRLVEFVDDLPRTATGKIQRFKLRA
ncbi:benzoate-CoA ligase family protein [Salsipaludibacter albus]|uniref:benzoate-CoA ligase family protein n=1 Tax=Salsipaludibacter albus TaxID=2849650 RepID=UPI001EE3B08D|nr:benzoate-CoA ligase family protein [Salsipaludibacter albus]MBY5163651.1 benzoate-CoA ligase family protein [Salsipaludibacter albus]